MSELSQAELSTRITDVREAIQRVLVSQSQGSPGAGNVTRANLTELRRLEKDLMAEYRVRFGGGGLAINQGIVRRAS